MAGYSVLTHQQLVDLAWRDSIRPLLLARFPHTTPDELREAHAYAFGGCAIQDTGYYPFGREFFSDLTHYVRAGDFIASLFRHARNVNEYAFAIGAFSHYLGDTVGHEDAINPATAIAFPKLAKKYGSRVTYDEAPHAHVRTEFAFDIGELSRHRLAPGAYLRFIGLRVPRTLLEQAFEDIYGLRLREVLGPERPAIRSYRSAVRSFLPRFAYAETVIHRRDFPPEIRNNEFQEFLDRLERADFEPHWNPFRREPGVRTYLLAILIRIVPKIGVLSDLAIKIPITHTQDLYFRSVNRTVEAYSGWLQKLKAQPGLVPELANLDLDTGEVSTPGAYARTDRSYAKLLHRTVKDPHRPIPRGVKAAILCFYDGQNGSGDVKDLAILENMPVLATGETSLKSSRSAAALSTAGEGCSSR